MIAIVVATLVSVAGVESPRKCGIRIGELVPNAQVARAIGEAIIRSRQTAEQMSRYELQVEQGKSGKWIVFQGLPDPPPDAQGNITVTMGGGGLGMEIDRCNGAVSNVHYQR